MYSPTLNRLWMLLCLSLAMALGFFAAVDGGHDVPRAAQAQGGVIGLPPPVMAAGYMKLGDIKGESTDAEHKDWIIIESMSSPIFRSVGDASGQSRRRGDVILEDVSLSKEMDASTPKIQEAVCEGKVFPKVEIHLTADYADGARKTYYAYEMTNVMVSSYSLSAEIGGVPTEDLALNYEEYKVTYTQFDDTGSPTGETFGQCGNEKGAG